MNDTINVPEKYRESENHKVEENVIDIMQLDDDIDQYLSAESTNEQLIRGIAEELRRRVGDNELFLDLMHSIAHAGEEIFLDGAGEKYGYGVYNAHKNCFVGLPETDGSVDHTTEDHVARDKENLLRSLKLVVERENIDDWSHLRVVTVRLNNALDGKADEQLESDKE